MDKISFGQRLKSAISSAGLVQADAAEKLDIALPTLSKYINGHRVPDADLVIRVAKLSGCDINWLLTGEGSMKQEGTGALELPEIATKAQEAYLAALATSPFLAGITLNKDPGLELIMEWLLSYCHTAQPQEWEIFKASFIRNYPRYAAWIEKKEAELQMSLVR